MSLRTTPGRRRCRSRWRPCFGTRRRSGFCVFSGCRWRIRNCRRTYEAANGSTDIRSWVATDVSDQKDAIVAAIVKGVANNIGDAASCFEPRHALRVKTADGRAAELVICFECLQISATVQGREFDLYTANHAQPLLEQLLRRGNIPPYVQEAP
jgi:hypothetical protein